MFVIVIWRAGRTRPNSSPRPSPFCWVLLALPGLPHSLPHSAGPLPSCQTPPTTQSEEIGPKWRRLGGGTFSLPIVFSKVRLIPKRKKICSRVFSSVHLGWRSIVFDVRNHTSTQTCRSRQGNGILTDLHSSLATLADRPAVSHCSSGNPAGTVPLRRHQPGLAGCCHHCHIARGPVMPASAEWAVLEWTPRGSHTRTWGSARRGAEWGLRQNTALGYVQSSDNSKKSSAKAKHMERIMFVLQLSMFELPPICIKFLNPMALNYHFIFKFYKMIQTKAL